MVELNARSRFAVTLIAIAAVFTLILQTAVDVSSGDGLLPSLWTQSFYFTNLTVLVAAIIFCGAAIGASWPGASWFGGTTVWIVLVGAVYHALLSATHHPEGWDVLVNILQHTALPIGVLLAWLFYLPKARLRAVDAFIWVAFPLGYACYSLVRGSIAGEFPYFFLDPIKSGWLGVLAYVLGLGLAFLLAGLALVALSKLLANKGTRKA